MHSGHAPGQSVSVLEVFRTTVPSMIDLLYVAGTIGFFALMILYVRALEHLGRRESPGKDP